MFFIVKRGHDAYQQPQVALTELLQSLDYIKYGVPGIHNGEIIMQIHELVIEMKLLERRLTLYEEKYGILSEDFYKALVSGKLERYDEYNKTRADFSRWKGIYETWLRRKETYMQQIQQQDLVATLRIQPVY